MTWFILLKSWRANVRSHLLKSTASTSSPRGEVTTKREREAARGRSTSIAAGVTGGGSSVPEREDKAIGIGGPAAAPGDPACARTSIHQDVIPPMRIRILRGPSDNVSHHPLGTPGMITPTSRRRGLRSAAVPAPPRTGPISIGEAAGRATGQRQSLGSVLESARQHPGVEQAEITLTGAPAPDVVRM